MTNSRRITTSNISNNPWFLGFESLFDEFEKLGNRNNNYPPHDIYRVNKDDPSSDFVIEIALAGIDKSDLDVTATEEMLSVEYEPKKSGPDTVDKTYIHRGISKRRFKLEWALNHNIEVRSADWDNGVLSIRLRQTQKDSFKRIEIK